MPFVSFIIPTLGRDSLADTIASLVSQTDGDWEAFVVLDDSYMLTGRAGETVMEWDQRVHLLVPSISGSAGLLRNYAISKCTSEWIAFVDDDDTLEPQYVEHLHAHAEDYPSADVVLFRMKHPKYGILPREQLPTISQGLVGISYAVRARIKPKFLKEEVVSDTDTRLNTHEDIELLLDLRNKGHELYISKHVDYIVGEN